MLDECRAWVKDESSRGSGGEQRRRKKVRKEQSSKKRKRKRKYKIRSVDDFSPLAVFTILNLVDV